MIKNNKLKIGIFSQTNPFLIKVLGDLFYSCYDYIDVKNYQKELQKYDFILFFNPYKNKKILQIYNYCKKHNIKYYVAERGALANSVFFDPNGFNYDSTSYGSRYWDYELSLEKKKSLSHYIQSETTNDNALEVQAKKEGVSALREKLNIGEKKVIFVPLQKKDDTVIKHFIGEVQSFDNFVHQINQLAQKISEDYCIVVKKHPLEKSIPKLNEKIITSDDNIKDLIELSEHIVLINSGVGVLAMMWYKPVIIMGNAFYEHNSLNTKASNADEIVSILNKGFHPDKEKCERFLSYLIHEFYSFGSFEYQQVGSSRILRAVDYHILRLGKFKIENIEIESKNKQSLYYIYLNSKLYIIAQHIKKLSVVAKPLLWFKHKVLRWDV